MKYSTLLTLTILFYSTAGCQQKELKVEPLTQKHLATYLSMQYINTTNLSQEQLQQGTALLIESYKEDPKGTLEMLDKHLENNPQLKVIFEKLTTPIYNLQEKNTINNDSIKTSIPTSKGNDASNLPQGFQEFRRILKYDDMSYFNNPKANELRTFFSNTQIRYEKVNSYGTFGGTSYSEIIVFCADGSFSYQSSSMVSVDTGDASGLDSDKNSVTGYWDAFTQQGSLIVALYSNHPKFIEENDKGFMTLLIKNAQQDVVRIAGEGQDFLYRRTVISCN